MTGKRAIQQLDLAGFLSYWNASVDLFPLNVLIGPNASGKSNLIEAFAVFRAATGDLAATLREGGGVDEYVRKGERQFELEVKVEDPGFLVPGAAFKYSL